MKTFSKVENLVKVPLVFQVPILEKKFRCQRVNRLKTKMSVEELTNQINLQGDKVRTLKANPNHDKVLSYIFHFSDVIYLNFKIG